MKQFKFMTLALTLLLGVSFTSCLDSDSESVYDGGGYVRVGMYGLCFEDLSGNYYYPTSTSLAQMTSNGFNMSSSDLCYILYKFVESSSSSSTRAGASYTIELKAAQSIDSYDAYSVSSEEGLENYRETAPIVSVTPYDSYYGTTSSPMLYGKEMVILPVQWKMTNSSDMLAQHTFNLLYLPDENEATNGTMTLYLRHDRGSDESAEVSATVLKAFDIEYLVDSYNMRNGSYPRYIKIRYKAGTTTEMPSTYTDYTITTNFNN